MNIKTIIIFSCILAGCHSASHGRQNALNQSEIGSGEKTLKEKKLLIRPGLFFHYLIIHKTSTNGFHLIHQIIIVR